jgi:hypothetical protein
MEVDVVLDHAIAIVGFAAVAAAWVAVQLAWSKTFAGWFTDPDVLAERQGCGNCGCSEACERAPRERTDSPAGDSR